jgi:inorganic triphosphatase YgiF
MQLRCSRIRLTPDTDEAAPVAASLQKIFEERTWKFGEARKKRQFIEDAAKRFSSPELVREIANNPEMLKVLEDAAEDKKTIGEKSPENPKLR